MFRPGDGAALTESWPKSAIVAAVCTINETHAANEARARAIALMGQVAMEREWLRALKDMLADLGYESGTEE